MADTRKKFHSLDEVNQKLASWEEKREKAQEIKDYIQETAYKLTKFSSCPHHIKGEKLEVNFDFDKREGNLLKFVENDEELEAYDYVVYFEEAAELLEKVYDELEEAELSNLENRGYDFSELGAKIDKILKLL